MRGSDSSVLLTVFNQKEAGIFGFSVGGCIAQLVTVTVTVTVDVAAAGWHNRPKTRRREIDCKS
ncbi:hypothetical protein K504DRAFT_464109 [Pleomassaria siparia CBS 279.74]|uniref:Uncharacterized protein n=1 Tax=Pleomassaria siparia CBS 279.74 TaxID=1314801 RepID=A0A6G1KGQ1_9PLEO|nr:hypothetical protein K504DRAFT_464109 [Pleomassaria siparia CBS 279.74]